MSEFFDKITPELAKFIVKQPVFFVATAAPGRESTCRRRGWTPSGCWMKGGSATLI